MTRHDSHIRSDWLNIGVTRGQAVDLAFNTMQKLIEQGFDFDSNSSAHSGRRQACDFITATSPRDWKKTHDNSHTIKIRGCDHYRAAAKTIANELIAQHNTEWLANEQHEAIETEPTIEQQKQAVLDQIKEILR